MRTVYCGDYTALCVTPYGQKLYVDTRDTSLAPHIMLGAAWEPWVSNTLGQVLKRHPGATFIDVGANVGWFTMLACAHGGGRVWAFEPNGRMVELLRKSISVNGLGTRATVVHAACGAGFGKEWLLCDPAEAGGAHLDPGYSPLGPVPAYHHRVDLVPLDDLEHLLPDAQLVIKIDVEGYEHHVLAGAERLLKRGPILFIEHHQDPAHRAMLAMLHDAGYQLQLVQHSGWPSEPLTVAQAEACDDAETILCTPQERTTDHERATHP